MGQTLREMSQDMKELEDMLIEGTLPEEAYADTKEMIMLDMQDKALGYMKVDLNLDDYIDAASKEIARIQDIKKKLQNAKQNLRTRIKDAMDHAGISKIAKDDKSVTITLGKAPVICKVTDVDALAPEWYDVVVTKKPKTAEIKKALQEGVEVEGAELGEGSRSLRIY